MDNIIKNIKKYNMLRVGDRVAVACSGGKDSMCLLNFLWTHKDELGITVCAVNVDHDIMEEKTAVCEEVAIAMVKGAIDTLNVDYAISATGFAGPSSDSPLVPVGTIWLACGSKDDVVTLKLEEDNGRDLNLANATSQALKLFLEYITQRLPIEETEG